MAVRVCCRLRKCAAGWACSVCFAGPGWRVAPSESRSRSFRSFDPGGNFQTGEKQLWQDLLSYPSDWWDNRLDKRSPRHPDFRHKRTREGLWLKSLDKPPMGLDSALAGSLLRAGSVGCCGPGDEVERFCEAGLVDKAVDVLLRMDQLGIVPSVNMYHSVLKACAMSKALAQAKRVGHHIAKRGLESIRFLGEYVVSTLVKCCGLEDGVEVFHRLSHRTVFSWTALIAGYTSAGQAKEALRMYHWMREEGVEPDKYTFVTLLRACGSLSDLGEGRRIHAEALRYRWESDLFVGTCLIHMYGKCGSIVDAQTVFNGLSERSVVSWTVILAAYCAQQGQAEKALELYEQMREEGLSPDDRTFVNVLQACGALAEEEEDHAVDGQVLKVKSFGRGKALHADAWTKGLQSDTFVGNSLVSMYSKCGSILDALKVFDGLSERDLVSWNSMLSAYSQVGKGDKTLELYGKMQEEGVSPDHRTFVSAFQACGILAEKEEDVVLGGQATKVKALRMGRVIHAFAHTKGYHTDVFVGSALISMYGKCGSILRAEDVFDGLSQRDVVLWTAMLTAYVEQGQGAMALELYRQMEVEGISPNEITLMCILQACSTTGSLDVCRQIHQTVLLPKANFSPRLVNTLIHAYGRCASMVDAQCVFDTLPQPDVVSWTALIAGYARQGDSGASLQCYEEMLLAGVKPEGVTFLSLLSVCSHAGLVSKGVEYFETMSRDYGITPQIEHYVCMVDLLGRAGHFTRVEHLLSTMPIQPDLSTWLCLLGACRKHGKVLLGKEAFDSAVRLQPKHAAAYVLMSNIYADAGLLEGSEEVNMLELEAVAWKKPPGQTWIEHQHDVHMFAVGDSRHPQGEQVYNQLDKVRELKNDMHISRSETLFGTWRKHFRRKSC